MEVIIDSPVGFLKLLEENNWLTGLYFTDRSDSTANPKSEVLLNTAKQLNEYFAGDRQVFDLPLKPEGTDFQQKVWQELLNIPYGTTVSYQQVANRLGDPKCIRAAARANGKNPIAIIIPCHRVIGADGKMTGYAGGINRKQELLTLEGAAVMNQMNIF